MPEHGKRIPAIVIGATGYVGGELLRLIAGHPSLSLHAAASGAQAGEAIAAHFPHLATAVGDARFVGIDDAIEAVGKLERAAVFSGAPHGAAAAVIDRLLETAAAAGTDLKLVDASADFRFTDVGEYTGIYGGAHGAPARLAEFTSAVPEHVEGTPAGHVGHPGCFATAMQLAIVPLMARGLAEADVVATGITGATGSGKSPTPTTHMPERHSNLFAYKPLSHRHAPEVVRHVANATGVTPRLHFVPHSGPFARGIHMTVIAQATSGTDADALRATFAEFYAGSAFVRVVDGTPRLKSVVASNYADIGVACVDGAVCVTVVIDNLVKGAAGGCVQWMNRLLGMDETAGLDAPAPGWT